MKRQQITNWKKRMQSMNQKAEWRNRKGFNKTPTVDDGAGQASCKTEDAEKLWSYWDQFWKKQDWQVEELRSKQDELTDVLKPIIRGACTKSSRPNLALFKMRIKSVKGCPGADGWSREEIMAVSRCNIAAKLVWDSMQIWEQFGLSPTAVARCKMGMIPKKDLRAVWPLEEDEKMDYFGLSCVRCPVVPCFWTSTRRSTFTAGLGGHDACTTIDCRNKSWRSKFEALHLHGRQDSCRRRLS